ncbi:hypothetical protein EMIHUDRAFT_98923 [Emiliania huxleyi CCMP1516]|uniref:Anaphase-promoting complex subunit 4 WD40 domain-containing protein n=2 Tax=Emiliania huxleyi TaxID=2903 RepID=A0A0D3KBV0_EMIH1|nr:hypothetical protein EMIHUDRAFT_98923 [Emiliania huxleyi CCMP1516]EOD33235.1 hypothetical protein EMIHUDRAFT_98923 [Emiliania huxleyi CCMP1516]|eukprot:XP_005785664.1 hypothetical protein EMIHUDRAFT_98923 [Emiliania huxleyi CCMP1516]
MRASAADRVVPSGGANGGSSSLWPHPRSVREYASHRKKVHTVAWNCSGTKLASGSVDTSVRVWTIDEGGRASDVELKGHSDSVDQLRWDPKNEHLLGTASGDKTVRIWDARTSKCVHAIETRGENINIRWSPDGQHLAVNEMAWDPSGRLFFLTTGAGNVDVFSFVDLLKPPPAPPKAWRRLRRSAPPKPGDGSAAPAPAATLTGAAFTGCRFLPAAGGHTANCYCLEFSPSGERFAVGGADALVSLWDELACVATFARREQLEWPVRTLSFSHDSSYIAAGTARPAAAASHAVWTGSEDPLIDVAHVATGKQALPPCPANGVSRGTSLTRPRRARKALAVPVKAPSNSIAFHPKRMLLAFAGDDKDKMGRDEGSLRILGFPS